MASELIRDAMGALVVPVLGKVCSNNFQCNCCTFDSRWGEAEIQRSQCMQVHLVHEGSSIYLSPNSWVPTYRGCLLMIFHLTYMTWNVYFLNTKLSLSVYTVHCKTHSGSWEGHLQQTEGLAKRLAWSSSEISKSPVLNLGCVSIQ